MSDTRLAELPKDDEAVFYSRFTNHMLTRKSKVTTPNVVTGATHTVEEGKRYRFQDGILRVRPGRDKWANDHPDTLAAGKDPDEERDVVQWLMDHHDFNKAFWREGYEPNRLYPREEDVLAEMSKAVAALDVDGLTRALEAEVSTHNRVLLTGALRAALESTRGAQAQILAQTDVPVAGDGENALEWSEGDSKDRLQEVADQADVKVKGTGADGNVLKEDLVKALRRDTRKAQEKQA